MSLEVVEERWESAGNGKINILLRRFNNPKSFMFIEETLEKMIDQEGYRQATDEEVLELVNARPHLNPGWPMEIWALGSKFEKNGCTWACRIKKYWNDHPDEPEWKPEFWPWCNSCGPMEGFLDETDWFAFLPVRPPYPYPTIVTLWDCF